MRAGWRLLARFDFTEEPDQDQREKADCRHITEDIDKRPEKRLLAKLVVELSPAGVKTVTRIHLAVEVAAQIGHALLEPDV